jgi:hypothetical protein
MSHPPWSEYTASTSRDGNTTQYLHSFSECFVINRGLAIRITGLLGTFYGRQLCICGGTWRLKHADQIVHLEYDQALFCQAHLLVCLISLADSACTNRMFFPSAMTTVLANASGILRCCGTLSPYSLGSLQGVISWQNKQCLRKSKTVLPRVERSRLSGIAAPSEVSSLSTRLLSFCFAKGDTDLVAFYSRSV